ncbi:type IV pilus modification protein PilV [Massilia antarctica]|uniref:Type IV pilus modification protein PilV n=1 Tax=Massilia antarctica TaxID=2765360 RepID=A0AA49A7G3_9BURK|nr:type IV pilus modification protein PilV [Massilia antarctica]QPI49081.1 type IV pilus modification protein PilV [Massilia antarctica]
MRRQQGFSMLEVLITMIVISVGLLGIAGLIMTNLKTNHSAYARGQATILANDIVDRMRANRAVAQATTKYVVNFADKPDKGTSVAEGDVFAWRTALAETLKDGKGSIAFTTAGNVVVTIQWDDARAKGVALGQANQQFVQETRL